MRKEKVTKRISTLPYFGALGIELELKETQGKENQQWV